MNTGHESNRLWTIKIESYGSVFYITGIPFEDVAIAAANGIKQLPNTTTHVFFAKKDRTES